MNGVIYNEKHTRYEMPVGAYLAIADCRIENGNLIIDHVEVPPELRGQGVAGKLMEGLLADAREKELSVVPLCSYAASYIRRKES